MTVQQYTPITIKNNIYLRYQLFYYWVEVFNEATFLMCKGVETVNTMIRPHATVSNTTKRQSVNCKIKAALSFLNVCLKAKNLHPSQCSTTLYLCTKHSKIMKQKV